jgi:hypothetical protein
MKKYNEFITKAGKDLVVETEKKDLFFKNFFNKDNLKKIDEGSIGFYEYKEGFDLK